MDDISKELMPQIEVIDSTQALAVLTRAEIDTQIATAKAYPRSIKAFQNKALELATLNEDIAAACSYVLPRGGKNIEGKSIRLAEIVAHSWGNLRVEDRVTGIDEKHVTVTATAHDLESNVAIRSEKRVKITNKYGERYNDDMIIVTANAACAKARRDAIFRVVPEAFVTPIVEAAKATAKGTEQSLTERRVAALAKFKSLGKSEAEVLQFLGRAGVQDITLDDVQVLRGIVQAIKEGELTKENCFDIAEGAEDDVKASRFGRNAKNPKPKFYGKGAEKSPESANLEAQLKKPEIEDPNI